jgi:hypothetical protein
MNMPAKIATGAGAFVAALGLKFQRNDEGRVQRVDVWGAIPVYDRSWPWVQRIVARRAARREARERDAP